MNIRTHTSFSKTFLLLATAALSVVFLPYQAHAFPKGMLFPIVGGGSFVDTYYGARANNTVHRATDIFAPKHTPIVAAVDGIVRSVSVPQPSYGYAVEIEDAEGFLYLYLHLNNDRPGTDDGAGPPMQAYAPDIPEGSMVKKGQLIGYLGDSGNAETTPPHLHFEILDSKGTGQFDYQTSDRVNPYPYLYEAQIIAQADRDYPEVTKNEYLPYGRFINARPSIAVGAFTADSAKEQLIVGTGKGYAPHVRVLDTAMTELAGYYAYNPAQFTAGIDVAAGDVDGDGVDEMIVGTATGAPHVRALKMDGTEVASFYAYSPDFTGGVNVAAGDVDGDGVDEIITAPAQNGSPHVRAFSRNGTEKLAFYAYDVKFTGGIDIAAGDVTGDNKTEIVTIAGPGGSAHLRIFNNQGVAVDNGFNAYEAYTGYTGGGKVSVGNVIKAKDPLNDKAEIVVAPRLNGGPHIRMMDATGKELRGGYEYEFWWSGNYDVAAGNSHAYVSTGDNRRASIREAFVSQF